MLSSLSGLPRFYLSGTVIDETTGKTECVGHSDMSDMSHVMHICWCIYVLVIFFVMPIFVSLFCSCVIWCRASQYWTNTHMDTSYADDRFLYQDSVKVTSSSLEPLSCSDRSSLNSKFGQFYELQRLAKYT